MQHKSIKRTVAKANCLGIYNKTIRLANERFLKLCPDLTGTLGSLVHQNSAAGSSAAFPIDLVIADYGAIVDFDESEDVVEAVGEDEAIE